MVTYLGSLFSLAVGREEHCKQISLASVGSARSVLATLGLASLMACVLSQFTLLRLQVALQGNCLRWTLVCVHFPGLSHSGSGSWVMHKCTDLVGPAFCALPRSEQFRTRCLASTLSPAGGVCLITSPVPNRCAVSGVLCVSSGELISRCNPPGRCQPSRIPGRLG